MPPSATQQQRVEHGWCNELRQSPAFGFYLRELRKREAIAHREVCARDQSNRDYHAGMLAAFTEASLLIEQRYKSLKDIVEVIE